MPDPKPQAKSPLENLTPEQRQRLRALSSSVSFDKITVSFSIEDRDANNRKKSAFYSVTASRGHGAEVNQIADSPGGAVGFTEEEAKVVHVLLSKHVVAATYVDGVRRGILASGTAREEMQAILRGYDERLVAIMNPKKEGNGNGS
jgi:hypothetical protein